MEQTWLTLADRDVLERFFLFAGLSPALKEKTLADARCRAVAYSRGQVICDPERFDASLGLILSGRVEVSPGGGESDLILRFHQKGDVFGAAAVFGKDARYVTRLKALQSTKALLFSQDLLQELMEEDFTAAENYMRFLVGRIQFLNQRIASLAAGNAEALLLAFLEKEARGGLVILDSSISAFARRLNISRASLYRAFEALKEQGLIEKTGKTIRMKTCEVTYND